MKKRVRKKWGRVHDKEETASVVRKQDDDIKS